MCCGAGACATVCVRFCVRYVRQTVILAHSPTYTHATYLLQTRPSNARVMWDQIVCVRTCGVHSSVTTRRQLTSTHICTEHAILPQRTTTTLPVRVCVNIQPVQCRWPESIYHSAALHAATAVAAVAADLFNAARKSPLVYVCMSHIAGMHTAKFIIAGSDL